MRRRLTPPDSSLPSPARPPPAHPRAQRRALASVRARRARGPAGLAHRGPLPCPCPRGPAAGGSLSRGLRSSTAASALLPAARLRHLPPVRFCSLPPLSTLEGRGCEAADPGPGVWPCGGGSGVGVGGRRHRAARKWPSSGGGWLSRLGLQEPGFSEETRGPKGPAPCGRGAAPGTGDLANGRRGQRHSVEPPGELANERRGRRHSMEPPGELANGRRAWRHNVEMLQNVNTARRAGDRVYRRAPHPGLLGPLEPHDGHSQGCLSCTLLQRARRDHSHSDASSMCLLSHFSWIQLFATPWTVACQAPLCTGFSRLAGGKRFWLGSFPNSCSGK
ncbi:translation initiation factor IF-2-like isoform X1 [Cervus canadensis]|uniref:translation initiation factor IF-2-like isoform X1 n=1 Tax=Cervus canadensis TaxID=1574408 RepID=UPI001C9E2E3D|nr:translation initiation factor IF-2-like isoform X1 [Cervus canadensis]